MKLKLKNLNFKIRHKLFVFERKLVCHPIFSKLYPLIKLPAFINKCLDGILERSKIKNQRSKSILKRLIAVILVFVIIVPAFLYFFSPRATEAAWFDDSYAYRQKITFVHNAALSNASMRLTIANTNTLISAGKMQIDCDDSRFTDSNGKLLKYKLVSGCNSASTTYDVVFPTVLNGTNLAFFYYGNPSAVSQSDSSIPTGTTPSGATSFATEEAGPGPVIYYNFDEGYGTTANNLGSAGATISATLNNMASPPASTSGWTEYGKLNKALNFDGLNDYVEAPFSQILNSDSVTVSFWFTLKSDPDCDGNNNWRSLMRKSNSASGTTTGWDILLEQNRTLKWDVGLGSTSRQSVDVGLEVNKQIHLTFTYDAATGDQITWVNGKIHSTKSNTPTPISLNSANLYIAKGSNADSCPNSNGYTNALFDELRIYNYVLSDTQVKAEMNRGAAAVMGSSEKSWLTDGLVGYWALDDGVNKPCVYGVDKACDSSGLNQTGTWTNGAASTSGKFANAVNFDGNNDHIRIPHSSALDPTEELTYAAWINTDAVDADRAIMQKNDENGSPYYMKSLQLHWNVIRMRIYNGAFQTFDDTTVIETGKWYHVAVTVKDNNFVKIYVNGVNSYSNTNVGDLLRADTHDMTIGAGLNGGLPTWLHFDGKIDDVRVYNRALSGQEISRLADWEPEPVGWWKLDERSGNTAYDSSGNNLTGTLTNGPVWATGKVGSGVNFDGSDDFITVADNDLVTPPDNMTISFWAKLDQLASAKGEDMDFITKNNIDGVPDWNSYDFIQRATDNKLVFSWVNSSTTYFYTVSNTVLSTNKWYYITFVKNGSSGKIFVNGVDDTATSDNHSGTLLNTNSVLNIGANSGGGYRLDGSMDDVRIYNYARSAKQIVSDMNAGHPAVGSPVGSAIAHYKFDEGFGTTANNSGPGGTVLNGTLTSMDSPATYGSGWTNSGKFGKGLNYDGSNDVVMVPYNSAVDITGDIALSAWIKKRADGVGHDIIAKGLDDNSVWNYGLYINSSNYLVFYSDNTTPVSITSNSTITGKEWHHVLAARNGSTVNLYIDGKLDKTGTMTGSFGNNSYNLHIGKGGDTGSGASVNGTLDEVKIYNYALSADEVKAEFNQGKSVVMGALATDANGQSTNSAARAYCPPGNTETNCAAGLNPAPVGEWKLDERRGLTAYDTSGNANNGTLNNGAVWTTGKVGQGIKFDGVDDHVSIPIGTSLGTPINNLSVSAWIKNESLSGTKRIIGSSRATSNNGFGFGTNGSGLIFTMFGVNDYQTSTVALSVNTWHHVAVVLDSSNDANFYVDGQYRETVAYTNPGVANTDDVYYIGAITDSGAATPTQLFDGVIDDVRVYDYTRSQAQIAWDYNRGGPVGHWKFDECQGATAYDSSGNRNNGTILPDVSGNTAVGTCNSGVTTEMWNDGTNGKFSSSLGFDGTNDYVQMSDSNVLKPSTLTVSAWVKPTNFTCTGADTNCQIFAKYGGDNTGYQLLINSSGIAAGYIYNGTINTNVSGTRSLLANTWQMVTLTWDGTDAKLYINGLHNNTGTGAITISHNTTAPRIGRASWYSGNYFNGLIDDVRVYNYALSPTQIKLLYNENSAVRFAPLAGSP